MDNNDIVTDDYQSLALLEPDVAHNDALDEESDSDEDPLLTRIYESAVDYLKSQEYVTIKDIAESIPAGESAIRNRLNHLVELSKLDCVAGSGRRPSFYYIRHQESDADWSETQQEGNVIDDAELLRFLKEQYTELSRRLEEIAEDIKTMEQAQKVRSKYLRNNQ